MKLRLLASAVAVLMLSGCASNRYCSGDVSYQQAQTLPPPAAVEGLKMPDSPSALRIPPAPAKNVPFSTDVADAGKPGKTRAECLDMPARMAPRPAPAEEKPAAASAKS
jgi:uncharacterized lipoprotein